MANHLPCFFSQYFDDADGDPAVESHEIIEVTFLPDASDGDVIRIALSLHDGTERFTIDVDPHDLMRTFIDAMKKPIH